MIQPAVHMACYSDVTDREALLSSLRSLSHLWVVLQKHASSFLSFESAKKGKGEGASSFKNCGMIGERRGERRLRTNHHPRK